MSAIVFAGASQLVALQLIAQESPIFIILIVTLFINLRFLMYSLTLLAHFKDEPRNWRALISYLMTDQSFAFSINRFTTTGVPSKAYYYLGLSIPMWFVWMAGTILGVSAALVGASVAVAAKPLPLNLGLILAALLGVSTGLIIESKSSPEQVDA